MCIILSPFLGKIHWYGSTWTWASDLADLLLWLGLSLGREDKWCLTSRRHPAFKIHLLMILSDSARSFLCSCCVHFQNFSLLVNSRRYAARPWWCDFAVCPFFDNATSDRQDSPWVGPEVQLPIRRWQRSVNEWWRNDRGFMICHLRTEGGVGSLLQTFSLWPSRKMSCLSEKLSYLIMYNA